MADGTSNVLEGSGKRELSLREGLNEFRLAGRAPAENPIAVEPAPEAPTPSTIEPSIPSLQEALVAFRQMGRKPAAESIAVETTPPTAPAAEASAPIMSMQDALRRFKAGETSPPLAGIPVSEIVSDRPQDLTLAAARAARSGIIAAPKARPLTADELAASSAVVAELSQTPAVDPVVDPYAWEEPSPEALKQSFPNEAPYQDFLRRVESGELSAEEFDRVTAALEAQGKPVFTNAEFIENVRHPYDWQDASTHPDFKGAFPTVAAKNVNHEVKSPIGFINYLDPAVSKLALGNLTVATPLAANDVTSESPVAAEPTETLPESSLSPEALISESSAAAETTEGSLSPEALRFFTDLKRQLFANIRIDRKNSEETGSLDPNTIRVVEALAKKNADLFEQSVAPHTVEALKAHGGTEAFLDWFHADPKARKQLLKLISEGYNNAPIIEPEDTQPEPTRNEVFADLRDKLFDHIAHYHSSGAHNTKTQELIEALQGPENFDSEKKLEDSLTDAEIKSLEAHGGAKAFLDWYHSDPKNPEKLREIAGLDGDLVTGPEGRAPVSFSRYADGAPKAAVKPFLGEAKLEGDDRSPDPDGLFIAPLDKKRPTRSENQKKWIIGGVIAAVAAASLWVASHLGFLAGEKHQYDIDHQYDRAPATAPVAPGTQGQGAGPSTLAPGAQGQGTDPSKAVPPAQSFKGASGSLTMSEAKERSYHLRNDKGHTAESRQRGAAIIMDAVTRAEAQGLTGHTVQQLEADAAYEQAHGIDGIQQDFRSAQDHANRSGNVMHNFGKRVISWMNKIRPGFAPNR